MSERQGKGTVRFLFRLLFGALVAMLPLAAAACSGHSGGSVSPPAATAVSFTPTIEAPPPEIEKLLREVADVRQLSAPTDLKVGLVKRSDVPALLASLSTSGDTQSAQATTTLYRLLGHLRNDQEYSSVYNSFVAQALVGVYSPKDKALWVVHPDNQPADFDHLSTDERQTLIHELTHAIQDAHFDLQAIANHTAASLDQSLAATCVIEGDAVSTQRNTSAKYTAIPDGSTVLLADFSRLSASVPASIQRELLFPYTTGSDWIDGIRAKGGNDAVDALFRNPPDGTVYVFHPELLAAGWQPQVVKLPDLAATMGYGWGLQSGGQFGQFQVQNYLQLRLPGLQAVQGADGWAGDHYDVYSHGSESVAVFRIAFSNSGQARRFETAQSALLHAEDAKASEQDGLTLNTLPDGNTTIRLPSGSATVTFVIGSGTDVAKRAAVALTQG